MGVVVFVEASDAHEREVSAKSPIQGPLFLCPGCRLSGRFYLKPVPLISLPCNSQVTRWDGIRPSNNADYILLPPSSLDAH